MEPRQPHRVQVLVAGEKVDAPALRHNPAEFQVALLAARQRYGAAKCLCQSPALNLVIREREGKLFLAAWPKDAQNHSLDCPFFSEQRSGAEEYAESAIRREGERTTLQLAHGMLQRRQLPPPPMAPAAVCPVRPPPAPPPERREKLHMWGMLHYLWETAGLNRWYPGWQRDWGFARYVLRRAAQSSYVNGKPLLQHLYIPPVWSEKRSQDIRQHWEDFCKPLFENHRQQPQVASGFVIGMARALEATEFGYALKLHHHAEPFWMEKNVADNLAKFSRRGWAAARRIGMPTEPGEKPFVVAAIRIEATPNRRLKIIEAALMRVSPRFIPVDSSYEDRLARLMVEQDRHFVRPLHYDNWGLSLPDFVLKDVAPAADDPDRRPCSVAVHVYGAAIDGPHQQRLAAEHQRAAAEANYGYWGWDAAVDPTPPELPPAVLREKEEEVHA